jgi:hypothetical protein
MRKLSLAGICVVVLIFVVGLFTPAKADQLEVLPTQHDFGDVEVGTTVTTIVSMRNSNGSAVTVESIGFQAGGSGDFSLVNAPPTPFDLALNETVEVVVAFSPSDVGYVSAVLQIDSTDWSNPTQEVTFGGTGVAVQTPPGTIQVILDFFDASVAAGTLDGTGPSDRARIAHRKVFRFIVVAAGTLIEGGYYDRACPTLERAYIRSHGLPRPKDFVQGEARAELKAMIGQLIADLGC